MAGLEVPGKCAPKFFRDQRYCQVCIEGGVCLPAEVYCTVCREFLCSVCSNVHRRSRALRHHPLLEKDQMPIKDVSCIPEQDHENTSEFCEEHPKELIKYFCPQHRTLHCGDCSVLKTHPCQMDVISRVAEGFVDSKAYMNTKSSIDQLKYDICKMKNNIVTLSSFVDSAEKEDIAKVKEIQQRIMRSLQEHVNELTSQISSNNQTSKFKLAALLEQSTEVEMEAARLTDDLKNNENNNTMLLISSYRSLMKVADMADNVKQILQEHKNVPKYEFVRNKDTEAKLVSPTWIGEYRNVQTDDIKDETNLKPGKTFSIVIMYLVWRVFYVVIIQLHCIYYC